MRCHSCRVLRQPLRCLLAGLLTGVAAVSHLAAPRHATRPLLVSDRDLATVWAWGGAVAQHRAVAAARVGVRAVLAGKADLQAAVAKDSPAMRVRAHHIVVARVAAVLDDERAALCVRAGLEVGELGVAEQLCITLRAQCACCCAGGAGSCSSRWLTATASRASRWLTCAHGNPTSDR